MGAEGYESAKHLKPQLVPRSVLDISSESEIRKLAIIANLQRLDLTDIEKGHALVKLYSADGDIKAAIECTAKVTEP